ncbi:hypothetical protein U1Q18_036670, partial [Sarracenia purpurea var. burkii]
MGKMVFSPLSEMVVRRCAVDFWEGGRLVNDYGGRRGVHRRQGDRALLEKDRRRNAIDSALVLVRQCTRTGLMKME